MLSRVFSSMVLMKIFFSASLALSSLATVANADKPSSSNTSVISSIAEDLTFDANGKLESFHLVYPEGQKCSAISKANPFYGYETHPLTGEALRQVFPDYDDTSDNNNCMAACLERGTDRAVAGYTLPHLHYNSGNVPEGTRFIDWYSSQCRKVDVCLMNYLDRDHPLTVFWINPNTLERRAQVQLDWGEKKTKCFDSYLGHEFVVETVNGTFVERLTIEHILVKAFGTSPASDKNTGRDFEKEIERTLHNEWRRHQVVNRTFSPLGFNKGRLPNDVFASMGSLYYNNRHQPVSEEWGGRGVFVNWWETEPKFVQIPWKLKTIWQERLADLVSAWAGVEVEQTVMYGLRQYEEGARLLTHVDRIPTHAVSLIVNVAQGNLTEPWPVEVFDHNDRLHEVVMAPGDIVYYESAKNLHSRNRPLTGPNSYYVNLFTHYRPKELGSEWHKIENPPGTPPPVLETEGSCRLEAKGTSAVTETGQLGVVQGVTCDDPRLGPYLSPSMFQLHGPEDLIKWWRMTAPDYQPGDEDLANDRGAGRQDEL